jgi:hypothetical protein
MLAHSEKNVRMPGFDEWIQKETLLSERRTKDAIFSDVLVIQN